MTSNQINVIVGASLAGAKAAEKLRREDFDGRIWDLTDSIQRLIRRHVDADDRRLSDPDVPLEELAQIEMGGVV
jgi:hypothetical protein